LTPAFDILYQDDDVVAAAKPEGLAAIPESDLAKPCLLGLLQTRYPTPLYVVHRLDKEVSGVILFARHAAAHQCLNDQFAARQVRKTYLAVLHGVVVEDTGVIEAPVRQFGSGRMGVDGARGKPAATAFRVLERLAAATVVEASPTTGRRHQLRVHFYSLGHAIVGDPRYGERNLQRRFPRLMLHAASLELHLPSGRPLHVACPPPPSFVEALNAWRDGRGAEPGTPGAAATGAPCPRRCQESMPCIGAMVSSSAAGDVLDAAAVTPWLRTRRLGRRLAFHARTDSTNLRVAAAARGGEPEGLVVVSEEQTGGRGRLGRAWFSPPGVNLYASVLLRPGVAPDVASQVSLVAACALLRAVAALCPAAPAQWKWPNDVVIGGRKLSGILCDMETAGGRVAHLVVGVGVNVNIGRGDFPPELAASATSLAAEAGGPVSRGRLLGEWLNAMEALYDGWLAAGLAPVLAELAAAAYLDGRVVTIEAAGTEYTGVVLGTSARGGLRLRGPDGELPEILSGNVRVRRIEPPG